MKKTGCCPKCQTSPVVRLNRVMDIADWGGLSTGLPEKRNPDAAVERHIALQVTTEKVSGIFGNTTKVQLNFVAPTEAFVCPACGLVEEYVVEPSIDWTNVHGASQWTGE